jgi:hypothetical protein
MTLLAKPNIASDDLMTENNEMKVRGSGRGLI